MSNNYLEFRNISTILTTIFLAIFGALIGYLASQGINIPFTAEALTSIASAIVFLIFGYFNAKHQNTLFDEENDTIYIPIDNLTNNQIESINNFINNAVETNLKHQKNDYSEDPSIAYEKHEDDHDE